MSADSSSQPEETEQRFPRRHGTQPPDSSYEGEESDQRLQLSYLAKTLLIHDFESSKATPSICRPILEKEVPSQETSNQWWGQSPLGADNTTDSLLTMQGVRSACRLTKTLLSVICLANSRHPKNRPHNIKSRCFINACKTELPSTGLLTTIGCCPLH